MATGYINLLQAIALCSNSDGPDSKCKTMSDNYSQGSGNPYPSYTYPHRTSMPI